MKTLLQIFILFSYISFLYSQNNSKADEYKSKVNEYLNESKEDNIPLSNELIKKQKVPGVNFSIEGKQGVNKDFLEDDFVSAQIKAGGVKIFADGDMEFDFSPSQKIEYDESVKLKDDEEYTDEEIAQFAKMADSYYQFKDYDEYEDFYYYYDQKELEKYIIKDDEKASSFSYFSDIKNYMAKILNTFLSKTIVYSTSFREALNYYYPVTANNSKKSTNTASKVKYDVAKAAGANGSVLQEALNYFNSHSGQFPNKRFMAVLEFSKHSSRSRFYIINLRTGSVNAAYHVSHGSGSDKDNDGYPTYFSNQPGSKASSIGVYKTGEIYRGKYGRSLRLHGLSPTNSNVYKRAIVIHPSPYVKEANVKQGRSWGCMAFDYKVCGDVINMLRDGGLIYAVYRR